MARCLICVRAIGCGCRTVCWLPAQADSLATFKLVPCPLPAANITTAAIFRSIEKFRPTLLLDEVETFIRENEGMRGALNSGFTRDSAVVIRTEGDHHEPTAFGTWCPKVKPITTRGIASILKKYGIRPKQDSAGSWYVAKAFEDAWDRYIPSSDASNATSATDSYSSNQNNRLSGSSVEPLFATGPDGWHIEGDCKHIDCADSLADVALQQRKAVLDGHRVDEPETV
jgi:hypothetical protein